MGVIFNTHVLGWGWFEFVYPQRVTGVIFDTRVFGLLV